MFLDKLLSFLEDRGTPLTIVPTISKIPVDLFRLYMAVRERGGFAEVIRAKTWKDVATVCNIASSSSAHYTLRKQYTKHILPFECKFDRGGVDPGQVLQSLENAITSSNRKKTKPPTSSVGGSGSGQSTPTAPRLSPSEMPSGVPPPPWVAGAHPGYSESHQQHQIDSHHLQQPHQPYPPPPPGTGYPLGHPAHQPYHPSQYPYSHGQMPPPPLPSQNAQSGAPVSQQSSSAPSNNESVSVKDPFADDDQSSNHSSASSSSNMASFSSGGPPPSNRAQSQYNSSSKVLNIFDALL